MEAINLKTMGRSTLACFKAIHMLSGLTVSQCYDITRNLPHQVTIFNVDNKQFALDLLDYWGAEYEFINIESKHQKL